MLFAGVLPMAGLFILPPGCHIHMVDVADAHGVVDVSPAPILRRFSWVE